MDNPITFGSISLSKTGPSFWALNAMDTVGRSCSAMNAPRPNAIGPFLRHATTTHIPTTQSTEEKFENLANYPGNVRIAISYDRLPELPDLCWEYSSSIQCGTILR